VYDCAALTSPVTDLADLDALTLGRAQRGDAAAFRALVERYHRPVFALLWRMLEASHSRQDLEDLTQETFLRVFRALPRFEPDGPARLSSWILTIASRLALNARRDARKGHLSLERVELPAEERADSGLRQQRLARRLRDAIQALPPERRVVLLLRQYHGLSYQEIAAATGTDLGTVKSRLSRAREEVDRAIQEERADD